MICAGKHAHTTDRQDPGFKDSQDTTRFLKKSLKHKETRKVKTGETILHRKGKQKCVLRHWES